MAVAYGSTVTQITSKAPTYSIQEDRVPQPTEWRRNRLKGDTTSLTIRQSMNSNILYLQEKATE